MLITFVCFFHLLFLEQEHEVAKPEFETSNMPYGGQHRDRGGGRSRGGGRARGRDSGRGRGQSSSHNAAGSNSRPGDWRCRKCNFSNFASRKDCKRCSEGGGDHGQATKPEDRERKFFDALTKSKSKGDVRNSGDALRFLKAACTFAKAETPTDLLYRLDTEAGTASLERALQYIDEEVEVAGGGVRVLGDGFLPLLEVLGHADLRKPALQKPLANLIGHIYDFRLDIVGIINYIMGRLRVEKRNVEVYAWFITQIASNSTKARSNQLIATICDKFSEYNCASALEIILGKRAAPLAARHGYALDDLRADVPDTPGGRHNNDHVNYRDIAITPTIQQVECREEPFLPPALSRDAHPDIPCDIASLLDRTFRLYHEDMIGPVREVLQRIEQNDKKELQHAYDGVYPVEILHQYPGYKGRQLDPCINFTFHVPKWDRVATLKTRQEKIHYWENSKRKLPRDSLVCFLRKNTDGVWKPVRFGIITERRPEDLAGKKKKK